MIPDLKGLRFSGRELEGSPWPEYQRRMMEEMASVYGLSYEQVTGQTDTARQALVRLQAREMVNGFLTKLREGPEFIEPGPPVQHWKAFPPILTKPGFRYLTLYWGDGSVRTGSIYLLIPPAKVSRRSRRRWRVRGRVLVSTLHLMGDL